MKFEIGDKERIMRALQRERDACQRQADQKTMLPFARDGWRAEVVELDKLHARVSAEKV